MGNVPCRDPSCHVGICIYVCQSLLLYSWISHSKQNECRIGMFTLYIYNGYNYIITTIITIGIITIIMMMKIIIINNNNNKSQEQTINLRTGHGGWGCPCAFGQTAEVLQSIARLVRRLQWLSCK